MAYSFVPVHKFLWELVRFGMVEEVLNELGEDGLEFFEGGGLCHDDFKCQRALIESNKRQRRGEERRGRGSSEGVELLLPKKLCLLCLVVSVGLKR
jgi:hypothetical protein